MVSFAAVSIVGWEKLAQSKAPLTEAVAEVIPNSDFLFSLIAMFATANTALILLIVGSRIMYGMASDNSLPKIFSKVGERGTPYFSVIFITIVSLIIALIGNIKSVAMLTDISLFIVYAFVNSSLILLRYKKPNMKRSFMTPLNIGKFPMLALFGLLSSIFMLFFFEKSIIFIELGLILAGYLLYKIFVKEKNQNKKRGKK